MYVHGSVCVCVCVMFSILHRGGMFYILHRVHVLQTLIKGEDVASTVSVHCFLFISGDLT